MESIQQRLGPCITIGDQVQLGAKDTHQYDPYKDKLQNADRFPILDEDPQVTP